MNWELPNYNICYQIVYGGSTIDNIFNLKIILEKQCNGQRNTTALIDCRNA